MVNNIMTLVTKSNKVFWTIINKVLSNLNTVLSTALAINMMNTKSSTGFFQLLFLSLTAKSANITIPSFNLLPYFYKFKRIGRSSNSAVPIPSIFFVSLTSVRFTSGT